MILIQWLGWTSQIFDDQNNWIGAVVDWNEQQNMKERFYETTIPVKEYLHKNGYFGIVGILCNDQESFVFDINARITDASTLLLLAPHFAMMGFPTSNQVTIPRVNCSEVQMIKGFDQINTTGEGLAINLASAKNEDGMSCESIVCFCATTHHSVENLF